MNGFAFFVIALFLSGSILNSLIIWGIVSTVALMLICLVCFRRAIHRTELATEKKSSSVELENATAFR